MERFCGWLRRRLADFKDTHGAKVLKQCQGEARPYERPHGTRRAMRQVDFSYTGLSDHGLWLLLDCLTQFEVPSSVYSLKLPQVQAAYIKLTQNRTANADRTPRRHTKT